MKPLKNKKFLVPIIVIICLLLITGGVWFIVDSNRITSLPSPSIMAIPEKVGDYIVLQGNAYPNVKLLIYRNGEFVSDLVVDNDGTFSKKITLTEEGESIFKAKQVYKQIESQFSEEVSTIVDLTPPNSQTFNLESKINKEQKTTTVTLKGSIDSGDKLLINGKAQEVKDNGQFDFKYSLTEGDNNLRFQLMDQYGNISDAVLNKTIYVDSKAPIIDDNIWSVASCDHDEFVNNYLEEAGEEPLVNTEETVVIGIGDWTGYLDSYNSVPIVGCVSGDVKSITVDGKSIEVDENNEIYERVRLFIRGGLNKYKVVVTDNLGNKATGYIETTAERDGDSIDVNLNY